MENEAGTAAVERAVREWVAREVPDSGDLAARAALVAVDAFLHGASMGASCRAAHAFVAGWCDHPANWRARPTTIAS